MTAWDLYRNRLESNGMPLRRDTHDREAYMIRNKLKNNLSYQLVQAVKRENGYNLVDDDVLYNEDLTRRVAIINSDNYWEKVLITLPGEDMESGSLIRWMDNYWLATDKDFNSTMYTRVRLLQCNYLLKWVTDDNEIIEQWCNVEDGTKYLTGEFEDRNFIVTRGDTRLSVTLAKNQFTEKLDRFNRFLVDDSGSKKLAAYALTKPLKVGTTYNSEGYFKFVLQEVNSTDFDNHELGIADYYMHFPEDGQSTGGPEPGTVTPDGRVGWL